MEGYRTKMVEILDRFDCTRLVKATQRRDDGAIDGAAFAIRQGESHLSLNCLDLICGGHDTRIQHLRKILRSKLNIRRTSLLAIINVGKTKEAVKGRATLKFVHEPEPDDNTHCGLYGLEYDDELVQDLVAQSVVEVTSAYSAA